MINLSNLFTLAALSAAINKLPYMPTKVGDLGIFDEKGIPTTYVGIDVRQGRLWLVPNLSRNNDPVGTKRDTRNRKIFETLHLPVSGEILPVDLQNLQPFGEDPMGLLANPQAQVINDKLQELKNALEITREWQRIGAIRGIILDADGSTIYNLYDEFGITQNTVAIAFTTATTDVRSKILSAVRNGETKSGGAIVTGWKAFCDPNFFDALTSHATVKAAYANWQVAQDRLGGDMRKGFTYAGVEFIELNLTVSGQAFIPANTASFFPVGMGVFQIVSAPANYNETVNTIGLPYYAKAVERKFNKGWDIEAQANPLALCLFPEALTQFTMS